MPKNKATRPASPTSDTKGKAITLRSLDKVDNETLARLSALTLPEIEQLKEEIATIFPAGNLPGLILAGLTALEGRHLSTKRVDDDLRTLFQGATLLPKGLYSLLFAGPAVVLSAYQSILQLSGKDADSAFPEGTWQFYLQFGLREDTGRHTNETTAYHRDRPVTATTVDDITSWIVAAIYMLFDSDSLARTLWTEWTTLRLIHEAAQVANLSESAPFSTMLCDWQATRPYHSPAGVSYADHRQAAFNAFSKAYFERLPNDVLPSLTRQLQNLSKREQAAYQRQMSLLAHLSPGNFCDERVSLPLWETRVGLIWRGHTFLIETCVHDEHGRPLAFTEDGKNWPLEFDEQGQPLDQKGNPLTSQGGWLYLPGHHNRLEPVAYFAPLDPTQVKGLIEGVTQAKRLPSSSTLDLRLAEAQRSRQTELRRLLPEETQAAIKDVAHAAIIINWDEQHRNLPIGALRRQTKRGFGDHPLTIMRTADSIVFDHSHIFFDGVGGIATAEIMTNQAISWCRHVVGVTPQSVPPPQPLRLVGSPEFETALAKQDPETRAIDAEVNTETTSIDMPSVEQARGWLRQRGASLTINDLLLLARLIHAANYRVDPPIAKNIAALPARLRNQVVDSVEASRQINPALLIPMDASFVSPRQRIFPTTFRNPLDGLLDAYGEATSALAAYHANPGDDTWVDLDAKRRELFSYLRTFGEILGTIKAITMRGESFNVATLKLLAHLPPSMQHLLSQIPQKVGLLNEVIKGEEVFSNVGRVAEGSSLARFMSAKDDGRAKTLVWGILTDDTGQMHINLRDFRPHVAPLLQAGQTNLAVRLAQDYVETYAATLNTLARRLTDMTLAEDEMRWS